MVLVPDSATAIIFPDDEKAIPSNLSNLLGCARLCTESSLLASISKRELPVISALSGGKSSFDTKCASFCDSTASTARSAKRLVFIRLPQAQRQCDGADHLHDQSFDAGCFPAISVAKRQDACLKR